MYDLSQEILDEVAMAAYQGRYTGDVEVEIVLEGGRHIMKIRGMRFSPLTFLG